MSPLQALEHLPAHVHSATCCSGGGGTTTCSRSGAGQKSLVALGHRSQVLCRSLVLARKNQLALTPARQNHPVSASHVHVFPHRKEIWIATHTPLQSTSSKVWNSLQRPNASFASIANGWYSSSFPNTVVSQTAASCCSPSTRAGLVQVFMITARITITRVLAQALFLEASASVRDGRLRVSTSMVASRFVVYSGPGPQTAGRDDDARYSLVAYNTLTLVRCLRCASVECLLMLRDLCRAVQFRHDWTRCR